MLQVMIAGNDTTFKVLYKWQYKEHGYKENKKFNNADKTALLFMGLESYTFGHKDFKINDTLLFRKKNIKLASDTIQITSFNSGGNSMQRMEMVTIKICYDYLVPNIPVYYARSASEMIVPCDCHIEETCQDYNTWVDVTSGGSDVGSGDSGTGGGSDAGTGGSGGTSGGGGDGGWQDDPCNPTAPPTDPNNPPMEYRSAQLQPCDGGGGQDPWEPVPVLPEPIPEFDPNYPFANLDNPISVPDDPLISSSVSISDDITINDPTGTPRIIAHTKNRNNTEDMLSKTNGDATGINSSELQKSDNDLFADMSSLFYWCTYFDNDLRNVGNIMIEKFKDKTGGQFENPILNEKVASSSALHNYVINFAGVLENALQTAGGIIDNVSSIDLGETRPKFNGGYNKFHGLQILVNDTEYTEIELDGFRMDADGKRTAVITLVIHDYFGLDKNDALTYQNYPYGNGFAAWWILQHKKAYKPFETIIKIKKKLQWTP